MISGWQDKDALGRTIFVAEPFTHLSDALPTGKPAGIVGQTLEYDGFGRTVRQVLPTGAGKTMSFSAFSATVSADDMAPVTSTSDGLGRILRTQRTIDGTTEFVNAVYDGAGRILSMSLRDEEENVAGIAHTFAYDSLGRLTFANDPDIGERFLSYNDFGQLVTHTNGAGQDTTFTYDILGRLSGQFGVAVPTPSGGIVPPVSYSYVYDEYPTGTSEPGGLGANTNLLGRLASVVEPNGNVVLAYDDFGRPRATGRTIAGKTVTELLTMGMSGQVQRVLYGHDFTVNMAYDSIGRPMSITGAGTVLWQADSYDGAGRLLTETFGNGVQQLTERDVLGLASRVQVNRPIMAGPLYDVAVLRNAWTGITSATDSDGVGLNHSATFTYDGAARLTDTTIGTGSEMYSFGYEYDGLQNMTLRSAQTPIGAATLDMVTGNYQYGESGAGPRQLTSVLDDQDVRVANFTYDDAGRMTEDTGKLLTYNGLDQLVHVELPGETIPLVYSYGYNGQRTYTQHIDGKEEYNFTESIRQEDDLRHHYLKIGSRTVARVTMRDLEAPASATPPTAPLTRPPAGPAVPARWLLLALAFALGLLALTRWRRRVLPMRAGPRCAEPSYVRAWAGPSYVRAIALAPLALLLFANLSCSFLLGSNYQGPPKKSSTSTKASPPAPQ